MEPIIHDIFETQTSTWQYIVADPSTSHAVIIDSVLDFDPAKNTVSTVSADNLLAVVGDKGYTVDKILETHAHADHLTASHYLQTKLAASQGQDRKPEICIGKRIAEVQDRFAAKYGVDKAEYEGIFDKLFDDDEEFSVGELKGKAIHLPGHTPDHLGYQIGSNVFCGDSLFNPDVGSARCDFPGGSAPSLYASAQKLLDLPDDHKIWTGHDYPPVERGGGPRPYTTVAEQAERNKHLRRGTTEEEFVGWRRERDGGLAEPRLLHQSLQVNIRAGRLPAKSQGGDAFLRVPVKIAGEGW